ncbi:diguanylate cyclase [Lichenicoccus roseus]|nr:diguanylate cyclase [Lichenicoccus roseus]
MTTDTMPGHPGGRRLRAEGSRGPVAAIALLIAGFTFVSVVMLVQLRRDTWNQAVTGAANLNAAMAADIARTIGDYDLSLQEVAAGLHEPSLDRLPPHVQRLMLFDRSATAQTFGTILVLDRNGQVVRDAARDVVATVASYGASDFFQAVRRDAAAGLRIDFDPGSVLGRGPSILLSRRLSRPDGSFDGVVVGSLRIGSLRALFGRSRLGPNGAVSLFRDDGTYLLRMPYDPSLAGRNIANSANFRRFQEGAAGTFTAPSQIDGVRRVYSFTHVAGLPLVLDVALAESDIFAVWHSRALVIGLVLAMLCATSVAFGILHRRETRRRIDTEAGHRQSERLYRMLADHASDVIVRLDHNQVRTYVSPSVRVRLGFEPEELIGRHPHALVHPDDWSRVAQLLEQAQQTLADTEATYRVRHKNGEYVWMEGRYSYLPEDGGFVVALRDISRRKAAEHQLEAANAELAHLANSDGLTGLANRRQFEDVLARECRRAARDAQPLSLLLLDVDVFKKFNDRYGHQAGDRCLQAVAASLAGTARRPADLAVRYGGEEMALLLPGVAETGAGVVAERVRSAIEALSLRHEGNPRGGGVVTVSVGSATIYPSHENPRLDGPELVASADRALYEAKRLGRNRVVSFGGMTAARQAPVAVDEALRLQAVEPYAMVAAGLAGAKLDQLARLAAGLFGSPAAYISLVGASEVQLIGRYEIDLLSTPRDTALCSHTIAGSAPLVICDTARDPRFAGNPHVTGPNGLRFYAGAPMFSPIDGHVLGALCIVDNRPRPALTGEQSTLLMDLAALAVDHMERVRTLSHES